MSKLEKIFGAVAVVALLLVGSYFLSGGPVSASVSRGGEYQATTTYMMVGGPGSVALATPMARLVLTNYQSSTDGGTSVILGSVVVASTTSGTFKVMNATSTTDSASTTIAVFAASSANGTYTFDASLSRGLVVEMSAGFLGSYTITSR